MAEINKFLDRLDDTREERLQERPEIPQYSGFRSDWANYVNENIDNLY